MSTNNFEISVIIPTWNRAYTIKNAINSVLNQTYKVKEILICDDGSTDNTYEVVLSYKNENIKYIDCGRNGHPSVPRNAGIKRSMGEWLAFLDSDDVWDSTKIERQVECLKRNNALACSSNAYRVLPDLGNRGNLLEYNKSKITLDDLYHSNQVVCSSMIFHKSLIDKVSGFPEQLQCKGIEDYALWLRIAAVTPIEYLEEALVYYNDDAKNSVRGEVTNNYFLQRTILFSNFINWSRNNGYNPRKAKRYLVYAKINYMISLCKIIIRKLIKNQ